jgi:hypothetical protein
VIGQIENVFLAVEDLVAVAVQVDLRREREREREGVDGAATEPCVTSMGVQCSKKKRTDR